MTDYSEQRSHPRKPVSCNSVFRIKGDAETHEGHVINLSQGGLFFVTNKEVVATHEVMIKVFAGEGCKTDIYAAIEVIRCFPSEQGDGLYGIACAIWKRYDPKEVGDVFP